MFTPHTPQEVTEMLKAIGVNSIEDLFVQVPVKYRFPELNLPDPLSEIEIASDLKEISSANASTEDFISFLGVANFATHDLTTFVNRLI